MAIFSKKIEEKKIDYKPILEFPNLTEQFKGEVKQNEVRFPSSLGEEHPFDFSIVENTYRKVGIIAGIVDKFVDFIVGPGFYIKSKNNNKRTEKIINDWIRDTKFDNILRAWIKEALIKGNGFIELGRKNGKIVGLKVLDAEYIYVMINKQGEVQGYNQYKGKMNVFDKTKVIPFKPNEIAHLALNKVGDDIYGMGIISPVIISVDQYAQMKLSLHKIMERKANSPLVAKIGVLTDPSSGMNLMPSSEDVAAYAKKMEYMKNNTEWAHDANVDMKVLDFGNISDKFVEPLNQDKQDIFAGCQIPEVLMGYGNIAEGLAGVQMDAFERNIQSKRAEIAVIIEENIFKEILLSNSLQDDIDFVWGAPSNDELNKQITQLSNLIQNQGINEALRFELNKKLADLLNIDKNALESAEEEREKEETTAQPEVPGQKNEHYHKEMYDEGQDFTLKEWLQFDFTAFKAAIINRISKDKFTNLAAENDAQVAAGYLSEAKVKKLKQVMEEGYMEELSIRQIANRIDEKVRPNDLYRMTEDGKALYYNEAGEKVLVMSAMKRALSIARTETTRLAAEGTLDNYEEKGIRKAEWLAAVSDRTCEECASMQGKVMTIEEARDKLPLHPMCRCAYIPVIE